MFICFGALKLSNLKICGALKLYNLESLRAQKASGNYIFLVEILNRNNITGEKVQLIILVWNLDINHCIIKNTETNVAQVVI